LPERAEFVAGEFSRFSARKPIELDRANRDAAKGQDFVPEASEHAANFAILAFIQDDAEPSAALLLLESFDALGTNSALSEIDAGQQAAAVFGSRVAVNLDEVGLFDAEAWVHEAMSEVAIVGEQEKPFAGLIEPADGVDALFNVWDEIQCEAASCGIEIGAQDAARFVEEPINGPFEFDGMAIDGDGGVGGIDFGAEIAENGAIDGDAAGADEFIALSA
jgi:hypothetical protein